MVSGEEKEKLVTSSLLYNDSFRSAAKSPKLIMHDKHLDVEKE
jgi:hypothetical protein